MYNRYIHTTQTNYGVVTQTRNVVVWHYYYNIECITTIAFHLSVYPAHKIVAVTFMWSCTHAFILKLFWMHASLTQNPGGPANSTCFCFSLHGHPETLDSHIWLIFGILHHYGHISRGFFHFFGSTIFWPDFASWKLHFGHFLLFSGDLWGRAVVALMAGGDVFLFFWHL